MTKEEIKIIDFFKHVGINDEDAFKYILNHKKYKFKNNSDSKYDINLITNNKKLADFTVDVPIITGSEDILITVYQYAKALNYYKKLNKNLKNDITIEILPLTLVKLYSEFYMDSKTTRDILLYEYKKALKSNDIPFLLAFNLQFNISEDYEETNDLLIPDKFYVDDKDALKQRCILRKKNILK